MSGSGRRRPRGVRSGIRPAGRPDLADFPLDTGIRPGSNRSSADAGEVPDGEVNAHLGNPGSRVGVAGPLPTPPAELSVEAATLQFLGPDTAIERGTAGKEESAGMPVIANEGQATLSEGG